MRRRHHPRKLRPMKAASESFGKDFFVIACLLCSRCTGFGRLGVSGQLRAIAGQILKPAFPALLNFWQGFGAGK